MATTSQPSRRPVYLLLSAALAAAAGNGISPIAFPWLVLQHNGSASDASIVAGAASLPLLFSTLIAGTAVDYLGRRRVSLASDALSATTVAAVPVLAIAFGRDNMGGCTALISTLPPLPVILLLCGLIGLVYGPIAPIYNYVMQTKPPPHLRGRVVGVMTSLAYAAGPLGFMLAGPLTDATGLRMTFLVLAIPMIAIGLVSLRLSSVRDFDESSVIEQAPRP
jgi:MFS family permease